MSSYPIIRPTDVENLRRYYFPEVQLFAPDQLAFIVWLANGSIRDDERIRRYVYMERTTEAAERSTEVLERLP